MVYFNYEKNQVLLLDQDLPEITTAKLYYKGKLQRHEPIVLGKICICKWMKDEVKWMSCNST